MGGGKMEQSLKSVITMIGEGKIVLPAMQRPFVWKEDRITNLIDSLLRGFPLGVDRRGTLTP